MALLVRNGRIITEAEDYRGDIYCEGETISRIEPRIDPAAIGAGTEVIDATGKLVFPGFIDPHVHIHLPVMGTCARDDYATASRAALVGGTTTLIEMICPGREDEPLDAFETWRGKAEACAALDYAFHMSVVRSDPPAREQLRAIVAEHGVASFKVFLAYLGTADLPDAELFETLRLARELGVIVTAHCENAVAVDAMQRRLLAEGRTGPRWQEPSRPTCVEADGVHHLCSFAELTGAHAYIVHTSSAAAVRAGLEARARGVNVWLEAVVPHLMLDRSCTETEDFSGAKYVMSPPLRERRDQDALWRGLADRSISTIATDHAPFDFVGQKDRGRDDFTRIPNGIPSLQERIDLVHTRGVCEGRIDLHTMVDACSVQPARIFGLHPRKGAIRVGSDADLVVYDPNFRGVFSHATSHSAVDYNAYEGWERRGRAELVTVRGAVQARAGEFVGTPGRGRYLARAPGHFA